MECELCEGDETYVIVKWDPSKDPDVNLYTIESPTFDNPMRTSETMLLITLPRNTIQTVAVSAINLCNQTSESAEVMIATSQQGIGLSSSINQC